MIELGSLRLAKENSIIEERNKIRTLTGELGYHPVRVIRLATAISGIIRDVMKQRGAFTLRITIDRFGQVPGLVIVFVNRGNRDVLDKARELFAGAALTRNPRGGMDLRVMEQLPDPAFDMSPDFIAAQQKQIGGLSKADELLRVILPRVIAEELTAEDQVRSRRHDHVAILFTDIVGFTSFCDKCEPHEVVTYLQEITGTFETISKKHQVEKIKTIGDAYLGAAGLLSPLDNPVTSAVRCGLEMIEQLGYLSSGWKIRIGIHVGPVIAGVVGEERFSYDLWGDTVNMAARIESHGEPGYVNLSPAAMRTVMGDCEIASSHKALLEGQG